MKRLIVTVLLAGLMAPAGLRAQKAYKDKRGRIILDLTFEAGMPLGAMTGDSKYNDFFPSLTEMGANNSESGTINETVFQKLEIAPNDYNGGATYNWVDAFYGCKNMSLSGDGWRLPTQREMMLIYIFYEKVLKDKLGVSFTETEIPSNYWTATENNATNAIVLNLRPPSSYPYIVTRMNKGNLYRARCVREVYD